MAVQKLTATKIDKYKPTKADDILADGNGLYLRVRKGQAGTVSKIWMYAYKIETKSKYLTLGDHEATVSDFDINVYKLEPNTRLSLETARKIAKEITDWRKRKIEPKEHLKSESERWQYELERAAQEAQAREQAEAEQKKRLESDNLTLQNMFDAWLKDGVRRQDGNVELQRSFEFDVLGKIGAVQVKLLTEHDLRDVLRNMVARGVNRSAVIRYNDLRQMFAWAEKRQPWRKLLADGNPMELIEIEKLVSADYDMDNQRERVISSEEIVELRDIFKKMRANYAAAANKLNATQPMERETEIAVWIMLSTICRVGELSMARWEHVDLRAGEWFIPKENVKDKVADLTVYLSPFALEQFRQLHHHTGHTPWCFPARDGLSHICPKSKTKQIGNRQAMFKKISEADKKKRKFTDALVLSGGKNGAWTPHDLRRTGATMMQALGVPLDTIDRCQNHVLAGSKVRRHYLHHNYAEEKRAAWFALGEQITQLLGSR